MIWVVFFFFFFFFLLNIPMGILGSIHFQKGAKLTSCHAVMLAPSLPGNGDTLNFWEKPYGVDLDEDTMMGGG